MTDSAPSPLALSEASENAAPSPATAAPGADIQAFLKIARNPEELRELWSIWKDEQARQAQLAFIEAFAAMQGELPSIDRRGRIVVYSKAERERPGGPAADAKPMQQTPYATFDDILEACRPVLSRHGFGIVFEHETAPDGRLETTAVVMHARGGERRFKTPPLKHDTTGSKNDVQAVGSALTYGRRYALIAALGIVSHAPQDADDDGRAAGSAKIDVDQLAYVQQLLRDTESDEAAFLKHVGAETLKDMTVDQYKVGTGLLVEKKRRANEAAKKAEAERAAQP